MKHQPLLNFPASLALAVLLAPFGLSGAIFPVAEDTASTPNGTITLATGKSTSLPVSSTVQAFVRFDLNDLPASATSSSIPNARLIVYFTKAIHPGIITLHMITNEWHENSFASKPGFSAEVVASISAVDVVLKRFAVVDVTPAVLAWRNGQSNFGLAIVSASGAVAIASKEGNTVGIPAYLDIDVAMTVNVTNPTNVEPTTNVIPVLGMVWLKPGTFIMGSRSDEPGRDSNEGPQTAVTLTKGFWICAHEVTQSEYQKVVGFNPSFRTGDSNRPVETVSWVNATTYLGLLTTIERNAGRIPTDWIYRLPTEAEWEYACRAGARTTRFSFGDDIANTGLSNYAWFSANAGGMTHPVEQKLANPWGLMDMHGNVWEWCQDLYGSTYPGGTVTDPTGPGLGSFRVIRGGSWFSSPISCRSADRGGTDPVTTKGPDIGFRPVLSQGQ